MDNYKQYINKLREVEAKIDYDRMYTQIERKISQKSIFGLPKIGLALASAVAVLFISFVAYFSYTPYVSTDDKTMVAYLFEQEEMNGDPVMNYIFMD